MMQFTGERIIPELEICGKRSRIYKQHIARYMFAKKYCDNKTVLDIGCGVGFGCAYLANFARTITGIDKDIEAIYHAEHFYSADNIAYYPVAIENLEFPPNIFDVATCFELIEHLDNPSILLQSINKMLKNDGLLILSTPNILRDNFVGNIFHSHEYTLKELLKVLMPYFHVKEIYGQYRIYETPFKALLRKFANPIYQMYELALSLPTYYDTTCQNLVVVCSKRSDTNAKMC